MALNEIVVETPDHNKRLSQLSDEEIGPRAYRVGLANRPIEKYLR